MKSLQKLRNAKKGGTTLVEMVVTLLLSSMMMAMMVGILSPAAKIFVRMQRQQFAQMILDNTIQELQGLVGDATEYVKIYDRCDIGSGSANQAGTDSGLALEFVNEEGYVVLLSTEGCPATAIRLGEHELDTVADGEIGTGRLLARYYVKGAGIDAGYEYYKDGGAVARAVNGVFADGYYMGNYLEINFSYPGVANGSPVGYLNADVKLYSDPGKAADTLVVQEKAVLELRYEVKREDKITGR